MTFTRFFKRHLGFALLLSFIFQSSAALANAIAPFQAIVPPIQAQTISGIAPIVLGQPRAEKRLSPTLQSPTKANFQHIAEYWLENYAHPSVSKDSYDGMVARQQTMLLPILLNNATPETTEHLKRLNLLKELQFLNTPDNKSVFANIDKTITQPGKISLFTLLATENTNWHVLKERQTFLKYLLDTPHLKEAIQWHLDQICKHEEDTIQAIYWANTMLAERELIKANMRANGLVGWVAYGIWGFYEKYICKVDGLNTLFKFFASMGMVLAVPSFIVSSAACFAVAFAAPASSPIAAPILALYGFIFIGSAFFTYKNISIRAQALRTTFNIAKATALTIKNAYAIHDILDQNQQTAHLYPEIPNTKSQAWRGLYARATSSTFNEKKTCSFLFSNHGRAENLILLCKDAQEELSQILRFYGELDAYTSLATLYASHAETQNDQGETIGYCFANIVENQEIAQLHAQNFWHPIIPTDRVRPSSLKLGGPDVPARNMVITGPNAGGKSVNLKALFVNLILAQTCGIACAESLTFTPFEKLIGKFRGVDDIASDKSKFMLEAIEMTGLLKEMMSLKPTEHAFVETDELFTGTEIGPAISLSLELCAQVATMKNVMYILATHYKQLCKLPTITDNVFINYKVEVFKDPITHKLSYPYKLQSGIGNTNVAFDIFLEQLEKQGVNDPVLKDIITKARERQENVERTL